MSTHYLNLDWKFLSKNFVSNCLEFFNPKIAVFYFKIKHTLYLYLSWVIIQTKLSISSNFNDQNRTTRCAEETILVQFQFQTWSGVRLKCCRFVSLSNLIMNIHQRFWFVYDKKQPKNTKKGIFFAVQYSENEISFKKCLQFVFRNV